MAIDATVGGVSSNSYLTLAEALAYFTERLTIPEWETTTEDQSALIIMATRTFEAMFTPRRMLVREKDAYYRTAPTWTGYPATTTQALSWPRIGMYNRNGGLILSTVIPSEIKNAVAELAGQLAVGDRTKDNDVAVQGITALKAGSVSLSFKNLIEAKVIPDAVLNLLIPSWLTDEGFEYALSNFAFDVL